MFKKLVTHSMGVCHPVLLQARLLIKLCVSSLFLSFTLTFFIVSKGALAKEKQSISQDLEQIKAGEILYQNACISCHGAKLKGATGFNLVDGEWIHGNKPDDIISNINNGFAQAGMPAFKGIFTPQQIAQITTFILAKREGWLNVNYAIYPATDNLINDFKQVGQATPMKSGAGANNLADFDLPENKEYVINFEGEFNAPWQEPTTIWFDTPPATKLIVEIDGEKAKRLPFHNPTFWLKPGRQHLRISYSTRQSHPALNKNLIVMVANQDLSIKLAGVSARGNASILQKDFVINSQTETKIIRRKTVKLPPSSVLVGLTNQFSYAFNTKLCAIVGVWKGEFLNVGPNIDGRGKDGSVPLGEWVFHSPESIATDKPDTPCHFIKYTRTENPTFYFTQNGSNYSVSGYTHPDGIQFDYRVDHANNALHISTIKLPLLDGYRFMSSQGEVRDNTLYLDKNWQQVSVILSEH